MCVKYYHDFWKRQCVVLHESLVQSKFLRENVTVINEEDNRGGG